jgi:hypothetical protein
MALDISKAINTNYGYLTVSKWFTGKDVPEKLVHSSEQKRWKNSVRGFFFFFKKPHCYEL